MQYPTTITPNSNHTSVKNLSGFSIRETAGAAAVVRLRVETVSGTILETLSLTANASLGVVYGRGNAKRSQDGVYVQVVSGTIEGSLFDETF